MAWHSAGGGRRTGHALTRLARGRWLVYKGPSIPRGPKIMKNHVLTKSALAGAITLALALPLTAQADTKIERFTHFGGVFGMAANDTTTTSYVQGVKRREESNTKFTGSVLGALQRMKSGKNGTDTVTI